MATGSHCGSARMLTILSLATLAGLTKVSEPSTGFMVRANWHRSTTPGRFDSSGVDHKNVSVQRTLPPGSRERR